MVKANWNILILIFEVLYNSVTTKCVIRFFLKYTIINDKI